MAEFIILWADHPMDQWDAAKVDSLRANQRQKYEGRQQRGDIIEVWPDGEGEQRVRGNPLFAVIKVPGLKEDRAYTAPMKYQTGVDTEGQPIMRMLRKHQWHIPVAKLPTGILTQIEEGRMATLPTAQLTSLELLASK